MTNSNLLSKFAATYFEDEFDLTDIGHTDLKRNNVFEIPSRGQILKIYSNKRRWASEVASLKLLKDKDAFVPKLIDYDIFDGTLHWVIMSKLKGSTLSSIADQLTPEQRSSLFYNMGCVLSSFHQSCVINQFGEWNENLGKAQNWSSFADFQIEKNRSKGQLLISQGLSENSLFKLGYEKMQKFEDTMQAVNRFSLCHNDFSDRNILVERVV